MRKIQGWRARVQRPPKLVFSNTWSGRSCATNVCARNSWPGYAASSCSSSWALRFDFVQKVIDGGGLGEPGTNELSRQQQTSRFSGGLRLASATSSILHCSTSVIPKMCSMPPWREHLSKTSRRIKHGASIFTLLSADSCCKLAPVHGSDSITKGRIRPFWDGCRFRFMQILLTCSTCCTTL